MPCTHAAHRVPRWFRWLPGGNLKMEKRMKPRGAHRINGITSTPVKLLTQDAGGIQSATGVETTSTPMPPFRLQPCLCGKL